MRSDPTYLGRVIRVAGAKVTVEVSKELPSTSPIVDGRIYRLGQIGSFVKIPLGFLNIYGIVSMVGASESAMTPDEMLAFRGSQRILEVQLVGEAQGAEPYQRGLSEYPTLDDEVHVVTQADLARIFAPRGESELQIGTHSASESLAAGIELDRLLTRHTAIVGSTGSGKSNTVAAILSALTDGRFPSAQVVIIDPHGEYAAAFKGKSKVFRIGDSENPLFVPYWAMAFDELAWFLVNRKSAAETQQDTNLRDWIFEMKRDAAPRVKANQKGMKAEPSDITVDAPIPFDLQDLWYHFDRKERVTYMDMPRKQEALVSEGNAKTLTSAQFSPPGAGASAPFKAQVTPIMGAFVNRILARLKDRRFDFLLVPGEYDGFKKDLDDLLFDWLGHEYGLTILDLAGVPAEIIDLVVGLLSRILFEAMFWGRNYAGLGRQRPLMIVYEEAHTYVPSGEARFIQGYARTAVQRILKEGRKYGVGAMLVSQRPAELDETILSQCGSFFAMRLTNSTDQGRVRSTVPDELAGLVNLLPVLRTGEALVMGEAMQMPSRIRVRLVEPRPDSDDPKVSQCWRQKKQKRPPYDKAVTAWRRQHN